MNRITLERTYEATPQEIWDLWTTKEGIESWWGPDGFAVRVTSLDLRPGGRLAYDMVAVAPEMVDFMNKNGMPVAQPCSLIYTEVTPTERLAWRNAVDFVPGVPAYETTSELVLRAIGATVELVLTFDPMHDAVWSERQTQGWQMELGKLANVLVRRAS